MQIGKLITHKLTKILKKPKGNTGFKIICTTFSFSMKHQCSTILNVIITSLIFSLQNHCLIQ